MNSNEIIFTSYCFGEQYTHHQVRLAKSILAIYPNANLYFKNEPEEIGKPKFQDSLYGFKVHMIKDCINRGFKKIIYFDAAICLEREIDDWFELTKQHSGFLAIQDNALLKNVISDNCLSYFKISRDIISDTHLVGGSVYVIDFTIPGAMEVFDLWAKMEAAGLFGTQDDLSNNRLQAHRMDEACLALAFHILKVKPVIYNEIHYAYIHPETKQMHHGYQEGQAINPIIIKRHFK